MQISALARIRMPSYKTFLDAAQIPWKSKLEEVTTSNHRYIFDTLTWEKKPSQAVGQFL
jgi:hypothetical protein